jgi:hypothetical protein
VHDLDGDGRKEVLAAVRSTASPEGNRVFHCLNSNGTPRWTRERKQKIRFGDQDYLPPFTPRGIVVTPEPDGTRTVWLAITHDPEFPEVVEKINHKGEVLAQFWHGGHVRTLKEGRVSGTRVMFVGYVENDGRRASLAVLDYESPGGFAPAQNDYYRCTSCAPGEPLAVFVFPRLEVGRAYNSMARVDQLFVSSDGLQVVVQHTSRAIHEGHSPSRAHYKLGAQLNFLDAFHDGGHEEAHAYLERSGVITHKYSRAEESDLFPVLSWNGGNFVSIPAPPNFAAARRGASPNPTRTSHAAVSAPVSPSRPRATQP